MPFAAAVSVHPVSSHATGELIGQVIEEIGERPDVAVLVATPGHAGAVEDVAAALRRLLRPGLLVGGTVPALAGQGADERGGPAMGLWAGVTGPALPLRHPGEGLPPANQLASQFGGQPGGALVLGRAPSPGGGQEGLERWLADLGARLPVAGALSSAGPLLLGDQILAGGAVGVAFGPGVHLDVVRAAGWRAIGPELVVTESDPERGLILALDGAPALRRLHRLATDEVPAEEISRINRRLGIGPAPASVWEVSGGDRSNGAIAAGPLAEGVRVRFWVAAEPAADLRQALARHRREAADSPASALAFTADPLTRGYRVDSRPDSRLDPRSPPPDADAAVLADALGMGRLIGVVAAAQLSSRGTRGEGLRIGRAEAAVALLSEPR